MKRSILMSLLVIGAVAAIIGGATLAVFNDTETSTGNTLTAGTLDLNVDGQDDPNVATLTVSDMKPCDDTGYHKWVVKNAGTLPGKLSVSFSPIVNDDNNCTEPESAVPDTTCGPTGGGELGQYLKPGAEEVCSSPDVTVIDSNEQEGWCIVSVEDEIDVEGTIGWGPKGWSVPSGLYSVWQSGPPHPWGIPGLNGLGGNTYGTFGYLTGDVLNPGQEAAFFFRAKLDCNLRRWDGTKWIDDVDDNIIQSDSVNFDIEFKLTQ
jgi:predicted ribosomally synthesized peptide with SipW-like signal peptide